MNSKHLSLRAAFHGAVTASVFLLSGLVAPAFAGTGYWSVESGSLWNGTLTAPCTNAHSTDAEAVRTCIKGLVDSIWHPTHPWECPQAAVTLTGVVAGNTPPGVVPRSDWKASVVIWGQPAYCTFGPQPPFTPLDILTIRLDNPVTCANGLPWSSMIGACGPPDCVTVGVCAVPERPCPICVLSELTKGNPVNFATGAKTERQEDYRSPAGLDLVRTYDSRSTIDYGFGKGWMTNLNRRIETDGTYRRARRSDGRRELFVSGGGGWQAPSDSGFALTQDGTGYTLALRDGSSERYNLDGRIVSETNAAGQATAYAYDGSGRLQTVTGPYGHAFAISYASSGQIEAITDPAGEEIQYQYDGTANYAEEVLADSPQGFWRLRDTSGTSAASAMGGPAGTYAGNYTLNQSGHEGPAVRFNASGDGEVTLPTSVNYTNQLSLELWVNPDATQPDSNQHLFTKSVFYAWSMLDFPVRLSYSPTSGFQFMLSRGDDWVYDLTLSSGAVTAGQWYHVVAVYRQNGQCELWVNGTMVASQTIAFTITSNSTNWKLANATENAGGTDAAAFSGMLADAAIYPTALSGARIQAHYAASGTGNLQRVDYPDGTSRIYHYENTAGPHQLTGVTYREANSTTSRYSTFAYESGGKAHSTEHAGGAESFTFAYNSATQTTVTDAGSTAEVNTFGSQLGVNTLRSRVNQVDSKSLVQTFDTKNNLTCRKDEEGHVTTYGYNASNQRTSMMEGRAGTCTSPMNTAVTRTTSFAYLSSSLDLPTVITEPSVYASHNKTTTLSYSDMSHPLLPTSIVVAGYTPSGTAVSRTVALTYGSDGQVTTINGPRTDLSDVTTFTYYNCTSGTGCGQIHTVTNAAGHVTTYDSYDDAGRVTQITDPNGVVTTLTYDERGRVLTVVQTPPSGPARTTSFTYNAAGNVTSSTRPDGFALAYTYNAAQQLTRVTDNSGNYVAYTYDTRGNRNNESTRNSSDTLKREIGACQQV